MGRVDSLIAEIRVALRTDPGPMVRSALLLSLAPAILAAGMGCAYGGPGFERDCSDGLDGDQDGKVDCGDSDCADQEVCLGCADGVDNDGNGLTDCDDQGCSYLELCLGCNDGQDNDYDDRIDCADPDCQEDPVCMGQPPADDAPTDGP